jgi:type III secretion protein R
MQIETTHPYWLIVASVLLALLPMVVGLCSSYLKVSIVLGLLKSGLGTQQVPSALIVMALSVALSLRIMGPVGVHTWELAQKIDHRVFTAPPMQMFAECRPLFEPWREFMAAHSGVHEIEALLSLEAQPADAQDTTEKRAQKVDLAKHDFSMLIPAFVLTEIKEAFAMGFALLLPFLVIDLVVANVLAGLGMMMVSPAMVSLPLKLVLFVVADGWVLLAKGLILSYQG